MEPYIKRKIIKKQTSSFQEVEDTLAVEKKLTISANGAEIISLYCTPSMIRELLIGLFFTQGLLKNGLSPDDMDITYGDEIGVDIFNAGEVLAEGMLTRCLGGVTFDRKRDFKKATDDFSLSAEAFQTIFNDFQQKSELFRLTGCFHSAAISDGKKILAFAEDIGRHNAVDKVIGYCILNDISFRKKVMLASCRISSEIVSKCISCGIPILASRAAATDLAVEIAEKSGVTLVGFVRGDRLNVYANPQRISR